MSRFSKFLSTGNLAFNNNITSNAQCKEIHRDLFCNRLIVTYLIVPQFILNFKNVHPLGVKLVHMQMHNILIIILVLNLCIFV